MDKRRVIYYTDELNDEFSTAQITPRRIDGSYKYVHDSLFKRITRFFWYRMVATPIAFFYTKLAYRHKIVGKEKLKDYRRSGYFLYGNHTHHLCDAVIPSLITLPKDAYVIVHPNNVSMPYLGRVTPSMGAIPLPDDAAAYKNFLSAIKYRLREGAAVTVYPEAHIWPFYTKIRPFTDASFTYPVRFGLPVFAFTNTYVKRGHSKRPRIITYVDGPFYPDASLPSADARQQLRGRVYGVMCERAKLSDLELIKYIKKESTDD